MPKIDDFDLWPGQELPDKTFTYQVDGTAVNFSTDAHTFTVRVATKGSGTDLGLSITAASTDSSGVVTITFADTATDSLVPGQDYDFQVWPTQTSSGKEREPAHCVMRVKQNIGSN